MKDKIEVVAFDADDTLWENEVYFQEFEHQFCDLLKAYQPQSAVSQELFKTEMKNLHMYGYGLKSMMLSMIETACRITGGEGTMHCVKEIVRLWQELLQNQLFEATSWWPGHGWLILRGKAGLVDEASPEMREAGWQHLEGLGEHYDGPNDETLVFFSADEPQAWICDHEEWVPVEL